MEYFNHICDLSVIKGVEPIRFVHIASLGHPDGHRLHVNNYIEIYVYISGKTDYIVQDSYYNLSKGDIVVITPFQVHRAVLAEKCDYERFYMLIPTTTFKEFKFDPLKKLLTRSDDRNARISLPTEERQKALEMLYKASALCKNAETENDKLLAYSYLLQFLSLLNINIDKFENDNNISSVHLPEILQKVLVYIDRNLTELRSAAEIADKFHVSNSYLSSLFKKHIKTPMKIYIRTRRVSLAKKLLNDGRTVTEACYESGFNDCSYFIRHFKSCIGMTPLQYKQQIKK